MAQFERLSAVDASFLVVEDGNAHMHVGGTFLFEPGPLVRADGGLAIDRIRRAIASKLHLVPRYRQKLAYVPYEHHPVWVDDDRFNIDYHVRLTALPHPGGAAELKRLTGRIMSQMLDRGKPLWELWFVEGLREGGFALISKTHHCMIDGIAGTDLMSTILDWERDAAIPEPHPWSPRPAPKAVSLVADALLHRVGHPGDALKATTEAVRHPAKTLLKAGAFVESIAEALAPGLRGGSPTPFNVPIGPHRKFDWVDMRLADVKAVKDALGGTVNDVVLATVSGALRKFLRHRRIAVNDLRIRAMVPVSVRSESERGRLGNRITLVSAPLPVNVRGASARMRAVTEIMKDVKQSKQAIGAERLAAVAEFTSANLLVQAVRLNAQLRGFNLTVTNVPGPQIPLYLHGAQLTHTYPLVPLWANQALGIALFSYNGGLFWGLNADWDAAPDLERVAECIRESFAELREVAGTAGARAAPEPAARGKKAGARPRTTGPGKRKTSPRKRAAEAARRGTASGGGA